LYFSFLPDEEQLSEKHDKKQPKETSLINAAGFICCAYNSSLSVHYKTDAANYNRRMLAMNGTAIEVTNGASRTIPYLGFSASNYFMINRTADPEISLWKLTDAHETTICTTVIN
jgi:hypothetical protein